MTDGVFGTPIDTQTLQGMPEYRNKTITRADRAKVARDLMTAEGKNTNCRTYVENLRDEYGSGPKALCTIYNATGDDLNFVLSHDFHGHVYSRPYPLIIKNGQWGGFLHVHTSAGFAGSSAGIVYRGLNNNDTTKDWYLSWSVPWSTWGSGSNRVYTEIRGKRHYEDEDNWDYLKDLVNKAGMRSTETIDGCTSDTTIGSDTTASYTAIMSLTGP